MPYITQEDRLALQVRNPRTAGELQYEIAVMLNRFLVDKDGYRYQDLNDVMGALTGAQAEFIRCVVNPYEDSKIAENGGVYDV